MGQSQRSCSQHHAAIKVLSLPIMKHNSFHFALIALLIIALAPLSKAADMSVKETPLTTIKEYLGTLDGVGETLLVSPDCQHIALVVKQSEEMGWQIDGETQKYFSEIGPGLWSPDSKHFAYSAPDGNRWRIMVDGKGGASFDKVMFPVWSPDSSKISYVAQQKGDFIIVNDNKKSQPFAAISDLQYNADGSSLAAIVKKDGKDYVWIDGKLQASADQIDQFVWSAHGSHYAYAARDNASWRVFHDDSAGKAVVGVQLLTISPDGKHVAYIGSIGSGYIVQPGVMNQAQISAKTQLLLVDERTLDSESGATYTFTGIVFSPDSQQLAWTAGYFGKGMSAFQARTTGQIETPTKNVLTYSNISEPVWSADSTHLAYGAIQIVGENIVKYVITDGKPSEVYFDITQPVWNPVASQLAYAIVPMDAQNESVVINDGKQSPKYDTVSDLLFSPDGKYFSYLALGDKGPFAVINGVKSPTYGGFLGKTKSSFDADGKLHLMMVTKKKQAVHVELGLK